LARGRERIRRVLSQGGGIGSLGRTATLDAPIRLGTVVVDFSTLTLPKDVRGAVADAFRNHYGVRPPRSAQDSWRRLKVFARFAAETQAVRGLHDLGGAVLSRYVEWLNSQQAASGTPWSKPTRSAVYGTVTKLLQWLERCRPGLLTRIDYPFNPFPWRRRDTRRRVKVGAQEIRALLRACEHDILQLRTERQRSDEERESARQDCGDPLRSRGALLAHIDERFGGIVPQDRILRSADNYRCYTAMSKFGGRKAIESLLYPSLDTILPYYLAILIHTAGNARAIAKLERQCLQPIPLLEDRELLIWAKPRAATLQRRPFRSSAPMEPPMLVRELTEWTHRLRPYATTSERDHLFLLKSFSGIRALINYTLVRPTKVFEARHGLKHTVPASIRPSMLTSIYRATGDLMKVKAVANHARASTTIGYVVAPEVEAQNRLRISALQRVFVGHLEGTARGRGHGSANPASAPAVPAIQTAVTTVTAVSMFGFDCRDPLAGVAPGTQAGEVCGNFLGCFTCPNAVIPHDARTLARLLQARDHLTAAAAHLHPVRWEAIYAPPLRILEEDILTRFSSADFAEARSFIPELPSVPPLR
jgi:hypothetical protein